MGDIKRSGGVAKHTELLAAGFTHAGYKVKVINRSSLGFPAACILSAPKILNWFSPGLGTALWAGIARPMQRLLVRLCHRGPALWVFEDVYGFLPEKKPHVLFVHSLESEVKRTLYGAEGLKGWVFRFLRARELEALHSTSHAVTVSSQYSALIRKEMSLDLPVILNALDFDFEVMNRLAASDRLELMAVGVLDQRKNFSFLVGVLEELTARGIEANLNIVGDGPLRSQIKNEISASGLQDRINLAGFMNPEAYYRKAHFLLHPSKHETFGIVLLEARKYGLVTLVSDCIYVPDELCDHRLPLRQALWVDCLQYYFDKPDQISSKGLLGHNLARESYSIKSMTDSVLGLLNENKPGKK
jgi:glycosyltransferase involved in cell wall biosynthesis